MNPSIIRNPTWTPANPTVQVMCTGIDNGSYDINPAHQREYTASPKWKRDLIETIFLSGLIPETFWAKQPNGTFVSIDGKQRLKTFHEYWKNGFKGPAIVNHAYFRDLPNHEKIHFLNFGLTLRYSHDVPISRIPAIFQKLQQGKPATIGELINAYSQDNESELASAITTVCSEETFVDFWNRLHGYEQSLPTLINSSAEEKANRERAETIETRNCVGATGKKQHYALFFQAFAFFKKNPGNKSYVLIPKSALSKYLVASYPALDTDCERVLDQLCSISYALKHGNAINEYDNKTYSTVVFFPFFIFWCHNRSVNDDTKIQFIIKYKDIIWREWRETNSKSIKERTIVIEKLFLQQRSSTQRRIAANPENNEMMIE